MFTPARTASRHASLPSLRHVMAVQLRPLGQLADRVVIGHDEALEAPLPRSTSRSSQRLACDGTPSISLYEAITLIAPPSAIASWNVYRNVSRSTRSETLTGAQFLPDSGWPWAAKCLSVAMTCLLVAERAVALKTLHGGDAQPRDQVRILAVGFLDAAPARIAGHVDHRRQRLMRAARAGFRGRHREQPARPARDRTSPPARSAARSWWRRSPRGRAGIPRER